MIELFAHAGEEHVEEKVGLVSRILDQPTWVALIIVTAVLAAIFLLSWKLGFMKRLLVLVGSTILIGIIYLPHNPSVTGIVLSTGFIATFLLTFTMLAGASRK